MSSTAVESLDLLDAKAGAEAQTNAFKDDIKKILRGSKPAFNLVRGAMVIAVLYIIVMTYTEPFTYMQGRNPTTDAGHKITHELQSVALLPALLAMCLIVMKCWNLNYAGFFAFAVVVMMVMFYFVDAGGTNRMSTSVYDAEKIMAGFMIALAVVLLFTSKLPYTTLTANFILTVSLAMLATRSTFIHTSDQWEKEDTALKVFSVIKTIFLFSVLGYFLFFHLLRKQMAAASATAFGSVISSI